jgi:hypothetical protein
METVTCQMLEQSAEVLNCWRGKKNIQKHHHFWESSEKYVTSFWTLTISLSYGKHQWCCYCVIIVTFIVTVHIMLLATFRWLFSDVLSYVCNEVMAVFWWHFCNEVFNDGLDSVLS